MDTMGLLLSLKVVEHMEQLLQRRGIVVPELTLFLVHQVEIIWHRLLQILTQHTQSLEQLRPETGTKKDTKPCAAIRQYAEFVACVCDVGVHDSKNRLLFGLRRLRQSMDGYLQRVCETLVNPLSQSIFLLNNYDVVTMVYREHTHAHIDEPLLYNAALEQQKSVFVANELAINFPSVVDFAKYYARNSTTAAPSDDDEAYNKNERAAVEHTIAEFNSTWKGSIRQVSADVMLYFSNFALGAEILEQVFTQFTVRYTVLETSVRRQQRLGVTFSAFQPLAAITFEMKRVQQSQ